MNAGTRGDEIKIKYRLFENIVTGNF